MLCFDIAFFSYNWCMNKRSIRNEIRNIKAQLSLADKQEMDRAIFQRLISHPRIMEAKTVYCYFSMSRLGEVDTQSFIEYALEKGIKIALPKIVDNQIEFYQISSLSDLVVGKMKIMEPDENCKKVLAVDETILIPGLAFDQNGNRLGYGKGYYDRYLAEKNHYLLALAYNFQIYDKLEVEQHDIEVTEIITDIEVIKCR